MKDALRQLKELQAERRELRKTEMDDAIRLLKTQKMTGKFVYASPETTVESDRRNRSNNRPHNQAHRTLEKVVKETDI